MMLRTLAAVLVLALPVLAGEPTAEEAKAKVEALKTAQKGDLKGKVQAIADAGGCAHATVAAALGGFLADPSDDVRLAAAEALGKMKGLADAAKALTTGVAPNAKKNNVLVAIFKAMGAVGHAAAVPALREFTTKHVPIKDEKEGEVTVPAINALPEIKSKASVEALLELFKKQTGVGMGCSNGMHSPVYSAISGGIKTLTGQTFNSMPGEAETWWRKHKDEFNEDMTPKKK